MNDERRMMNDERALNTHLLDILVLAVGLLLLVGELLQQAVLLGTDRAHLAEILVGLGHAGEDVVEVGRPGEEFVAVLVLALDELLGVLLVKDSTRVVHLV